MAQRRFHYEQAFEHYLRANGIPYVAVDEAKRALQGRADQPGTRKLKSFDFVVYSEAGPNLLVDVKGRKLSLRTPARPKPAADDALFDPTPPSTPARPPAPRSAMQNWVTRDDVACLQSWETIFGDGFDPVFAFLFWCDDQPPDALFLEVFEFNKRWYAVLAMRLADYMQHMRDRSAKWDTVSVPSRAFTQHARPLKELLL